MIVYRSTKKEFLEDVFNNTIADTIHEAYYRHLGRYASDSEYTSWKNSMMYMDKVMNDAEIPLDAGVSIEYQVPLTSKRIDFIVSGFSKDRKKHAIIVELKQWSTLSITNKDAIVSTYVAKAEREVAHPSYQAWSYCALLDHYNENVQKQEIVLHPCAYLHNCKEKEVIHHASYDEYTRKAPAFISTDAAKLQSFIKRYIKYGDNLDIIYDIENGRIRPSKHLAETITSLLKGNKEFVLLDNQKVAYETALYFALKATPNRKHVLIVEGGPGTGKSVIAVNLLAELTNKLFTVRYVSKNAAPRDVYTVKLNGCYKKTHINNLFGGSGSFINVDKDTFDVLIVDEAHRLNLKSGMYSNLGDNQIKEIIEASKVSIFFVDDNQQIHIKDIGSTTEIENIAKSYDAKISKIKLESQFRCNGFDGYISWVENTLNIRETANIKLSNKSFDFRIFDSPNEMFDAIFDKNQKNNKSRVVAGYCWDWKSKKDSSAYDIEFPEFNFRKKWNLSNSGKPWIIDPKSINEIGCIHTCQGLELDYVGVIIGDDISYNGSHIVTDVAKRSKMDASIKGFKKRLRENKDNAVEHADSIIKNTYRTLLTRGMKGCYVYCVDKALSEHIQSMLVEEDYTDINEETTICQNNLIRIEPNVNDEVKYIDFLPLYSIKAACGCFGDGQDVCETGWMEVKGLGRLNKNMFIVQAVGHSMEPLINDGDYCVFNRVGVGSREGKIVLVEHTESFDSDYHGSYSIKKYHSEKTIDNVTGSWMHNLIKLEPINNDYQPIIIKSEDTFDESFRVIGEFVGVVNL